MGNLLDEKGQVMQADNDTPLENARKILVVDDEGSMQKLLSRILTAHGFEVRVADNGAEALKALETWPAELVITDIEMPVMDGIALTRELLQATDVNVIMVTGKIDRYSYDQVVTLGASDYIQKPFSAEKIVLRTRRVIRERFLKEEAVRLQKETDQAHRFESIGQLAAGIAHEINTPIQYIGDNVQFIKESFDDLLALIHSIRDLVLNVPDGETNIAKAFQHAAEAADLSFLEGEIPTAIDQTLEGVGRIKDIIKAMKSFSHPGKASHTMANLNRCLETTAIITKNEWKYVAELEMDLDEDLPEICCNPGELNQVFLNLIVNASHAIEDNLQNQPGGKGVIRISTRAKGGWLEIRVQDTGTGIPDEVLEKMFDPFFTTKEIGKGTGQGLAISRNIITRNHQGKIEVKTTPGKGSTFVLKLPIKSVD